MEYLTNIEGLILFSVGLAIGICISAIAIAVSRFFENKHFDHVLKESIKDSYYNGYREGFNIKTSEIDEILNQLDILEDDIIKILKGERC